MTIDDTAPGRGARSGVSPLYDPRVRGIFYQAILAIGLAVFVWWIIGNVTDNLERAKIASGFGYLDERAGFPISQALADYTPDDTYLHAFFVGLLNTLLVGFVGVLIATVVGLVMGVARLSSNIIVRGIATVYVETLRNIPPLLVLFFWYFAVLALLPGPKQAMELPVGFFLSNRGLVGPAPVPEAGLGATGVALLIGIALAIGLRVWAKRRQALTGQFFPAGTVGFGLIVALPILVFLVTGQPLSFSFPELKGFNFTGGFSVLPEFIALLLGLSLYTSTFIAEVVRGGILAVAHGQTEAASALGLRRNRVLRLVVIPQAMRIIIPPVTNQYLNLIKNSSLAVAIGYPDLVSVSNTTLSQTGQAVEALSLTMLVYLGLSLVTAAFMNWFNRRVALVER